MKQILAVDDNIINLELLKQVIKVHYPEFTMHTSLNGEDAIQKAEKYLPDLILLDILMPGLDGYETCKCLKEITSTKHIPIIMISALGQDPAERTKGLNSGADAFISKPFDHAELRAQINVALRIKEVEDLLRKRNESLEFDIKSQSSFLHDQEERFLQISEHAREFYWEVNVNNIITYISPVVENTFDINPLDVIGKKSFFELFTHTNNSFLEVFQERESFHDEEIQMNHKGERIWLSVSGFSFYTPKGIPAGKRGMCFDITRRKTAEDALKDNLRKIEEYQVRLKRLNSEMTLIEENERRRIAENLHDSLGQTLSMAYMQLSSIDTGEIQPNHKNRIDYVSSLLNQAVEESRRLTYDLSPPILYELGLFPAIRWKLEQVKKEHEIDFTFHAVDSDFKLPKEYDVFLYRTVCEIVQNTVKHANATKITVENYISDQKLHIEVEDNGKGFNTNYIIKNDNQGGFGLLSIKERVDSISGSFYIYSQLGKGTKTKVIIPLIQQ